MKTDISGSVRVSTVPAPLRRIARPRSKHLLFVFIGLMYLYVLGHDESFLVQPHNAEWQRIEPFKWWLLPHGLAGACALFLGPLQFSERLRRRFARMHRVMGRFYIAGVLVGAPLGIYIQYFEERLGNTRSFTIASIANAAIWMFTTLMALTFIYKGNVQLHRQWMTRSFACALIFLEVRVIAGVAHLGRFTEIIVWGCVAAAVPLADFVLQWQDLFRRRAVPARAVAANESLGAEKRSRLRNPMLPIFIDPERGLPPERRQRR